MMSAETDKVYYTRAWEELATLINEGIPGLTATPSIGVSPGFYQLNVARDKDPDTEFTARFGTKALTLEVVEVDGFGFAITDTKVYEEGDVPRIEGSIVLDGVQIDSDRYHASEDVRVAVWETVLRLANEFLRWEECGPRHIKDNPGLGGITERA